MTLDTYGQVELRGLLIGKGTVYRLNGFNPFDLTVRPDNQANLSQADGAYSGREYTDVKQVPLRVTIDLPQTDPNGRFDAHQALLAAFASSDVDIPLRFMWGTRVLRLNGRPRLVTADTELLTIGIVRCEAGFLALDPRVYSDVENVITMNLPSDSGGLVLPFTTILTLTGTLTSGTRTINNAGTATTTWRAVINGPVTNPRLVNFTSGQELRIGVTVASGRTLVLDSAVRSVLLDGTSSRRGNVSGQWWQLAPGNNLIGWFSETASGTATFQVTYRDAWR